MTCNDWRSKLDAYADGELEPKDAAAVGVHLKSCASCAAQALEHVQMKRSVAVAGRRYAPSGDLRAKISKSVSAKSSPRKGWAWRLAAAPAIVVLLASLGVSWYVARESARRERVYSELADLHVSALASSSPVDVISTDRHTVKPWFQGKIPFSFNLPELQGSDFTLIGGRVTYLGQAPGAHLIYQLRKHEISVFIFQDRGAESVQTSGAMQANAFNVENWSENGLRYFVVGDVSASDVEALSKLLRDAH